MCVICYIPKNEEMLKRKEFKLMWNKNNDGAGIMWIYDNQVHISKGYFDFEALYEDLTNIKINYNCDMAVHFRWATHGGINGGLCHPFPLSDKSNELFSLNNICEVGIMHNGVISIDNREGFSDTTEYIAKELYPKYKKNKYFYLCSNDEISERIGYGKLLFFSKYGINKVGEWKNYKGCWCSNLYWKY